MLDLAELAARTGSIDTYERRGDVFFMEDYLYNLGRWTIALSGLGAAVATSTVIWLSRGQACLITAGSTVNHYAQITHYYHFPSVSKFGCEVSFTPHDDATEYEVRLTGAIETVKMEWAIKLDQVTKEVHFLNAAGGWTLIVAWPTVFTDLPMFYTAKLVVDLNTGRYVRFITGGWRFDLSALTGYITATGDANHIAARIRLTGQALKNPFTYVDNVILTIDEPA